MNDKLELISVSESDYLNGYDNWNFYYYPETKTIENKYDTFTIKEFLEFLFDLNDEEKEHYFINEENIEKAIIDMACN